MEEKIIRLKACFKGLIGNLLYLLLKIAIALSVFIFMNKMKNGILDRNNLGFRGSLTDPFASMISLESLAMLYFSYIIIAILFIFLGIQLYRVISLLMNVSNNAIIDYDNEKIIVTKQTSAFTRLTEENVFHRIIEVSVTQTPIEKRLNTGSLYIEYLIINERDSHIRYLDFDYIEAPFKVKKKLI